MQAAWMKSRPMATASSTKVTARGTKSASSLMGRAASSRGRLGRTRNAVRNVNQRNPGATGLRMIDPEFLRTQLRSGCRLFPADEEPEQRENGNEGNDSLRYDAVKTVDLELVGFDVCQVERECEAEQRSDEGQPSASLERERSECEIANDPDNGDGDV